jgi:hypothetical protein
MLKKVNKRIFLINMKLKISLALLLIITTVLAQKSSNIPFSNTPYSDSKGVPVDSTIPYFPVKHFIDTIHTYLFYDAEHTKQRQIPKCVTTTDLLIKDHTLTANEISDSIIIDSNTFYLNWYSAELYNLQQPILYNSYLGKIIYRFTLLPSLYLVTLSISVIQQNDSFYIETRTASSKTQETSYQKPLSIDRKVISKEQFERLTAMLRVGTFNIPYTPRHCRRGLDGSEWIIEVHNENGYSFIADWSPPKKSMLRQIGLRFLKASKVKYPRF